MFNRIKEKHTSKNSCETDNVSFGIILVVIGGAFLLHKFDIINIFNLPMSWWEIAAIFIGIMACVTIVRAKNARQLASGIFNIAVAIWLYVTFEKLWGFNLNNSWPILLIGFGAGQVIAAFLKKPESDQQ